MGQSSTRMNSDRLLGWRAVAPALLLPFLGCLVYFVWMPEGAVGKAAYTLTKLFLLFYPLVFVCRTGWGGLWRRKEGEGAPVRWWTIIWTGALSGVVIAAAGGGLMLTPLGEIVRGGAAGVGARADGLGFREHYVLFAVFVSVLHSAMEEYYWRWFVYGNLSKLCSRGWAHGIAGLGFAAHHLIVTLQFFPAPMAIFLSSCVAVGGVIWTVMYARQGTVVGSWISHMCVDALLMGIGYQLLGMG